MAGHDVTVGHALRAGHVHEVFLQRGEEVGAQEALVGRGDTETENGCWQDE